MLASFLWWHWLVLALPMFPTFWAIWHVRTRYFATDQEKSLWFLLTVFIPVIGAIVYFFVGMKRASKIPLQDGSQEGNK